MAIRFEWDEQKSLTNQKKHGFRFEEAAAVFLDQRLVLIPDRVVGAEERWIAIGMLGGLHLLLVVHTARDDGFDELVRIISARRTTTQERRIYEEQNG